MAANRLIYESMIDDRAATDGVFRVRRELFTDPDIFELEMAAIFEKSWLFIGLASQVAKPHDFFTALMGRQPVLVTRDASGEIHCFLNTCLHRGAVVCPNQSGNRRNHVCPYHGWAYESSGRNVAIPARKEGRYGPDFDAQSHDLVPVARFQNYRGLLFASLSADVPSLEEHLGDARVFLDLVIDQAPDGLEFVPGNIPYTYDANWKLQIENPQDGYHFNITHASYLDLRRRRGPAKPQTNPVLESWLKDEPIGTGGFSFPGGHVVHWTNQGGTGMGRPLVYQPGALDEVAARVGKDKAKWMLYSRNLTIFPNLQIIDIQSLQFRTIRPLAPDKTEVLSRCVGPIGESREARASRIRLYEDFFNPSGLATPDDAVVFERCQDGFQASGGGWLQGYVRGLGDQASGESEKARELSVTPDSWSFGPINWGDEVVFHGPYREILRLVRREQQA